MRESEVKKLEKNYLSFMGLDSFPSYALETKKVSLLKADSEGFDSIALAKFDPETKKHTLIVADNIIVEPYIVFHELTHILDAETYAYDKIKYVALSGFTEYHASQIELLKMLGANKVKEKISFSSSKVITTIGGRITVQQYVDMKKNLAANLFAREDFPNSLEQLKTAIGILFNYWGLRSVCYMYCTDFKEDTSSTLFTRFIPAYVYDEMNKLMVGWLSNEFVEISCKGYLTMIYPLAQKYKLL